MQTTIRLLPGNDEKIIVTRGEIKQTMPFVPLHFGPIVVELIHDSTVVRQEDDGFGELTDVYLITQIRTVNETQNSYHLTVRSGLSDKYETQVEPGRETLVDLEVVKQFESSQLGGSLSYIRV